MAEVLSFLPSHLGRRYRQDKRAGYWRRYGCVVVGDADYVSKLSDKSRRAGPLVTSEGLTTLPLLNINQKVTREGLDRPEECL